MLHYDSLMDPTAAQQGIQPGKKSQQPTQKAIISQAQHMSYLEDHPYHPIEEDETVQVCLYTICVHTDTVPTMFCIFYNFAYYLALC